MVNFIQRFQKRLIFFVPIILIAFNINYTNCIIEDVLDVIHLTKEVATGVLKAWDIVEQTNLVSEIDLPITREKQKKVLKRLKELSRQIELSENKHINNGAWIIESINENIKTNTRLELSLHEISDIIRRISSRMKQMKQYEKYREKLEKRTIVGFAEWTVSPNAYAINHLLERLHLLFIGEPDSRGTNTANILSMISDNLEDAKEQSCLTKQSAQQYLYSLYSDIALTELKGYTMMQFSWMMLRVYGKGNFTHEANLMREEFEKRINQTHTLLREVMRRADRTVWKCDPAKHVKGQTFDEITRLLQGYIENEVDMNPDATCRESCGYYSIAKSHGCFKDLYCARQQRCSGRLYNCQYYDSDMWVCPAANSDTRRYLYIEYENGRVLGQKQTCTRGSTKVDSWWRWLFWHCSYCFCLCDEQGLKSDRYFNLRETVSDAANNKVITGLRFVKHKRVFHLQIQEAELLPRGNINSTTLSWKAVDDYNIFDRDVISGRDYHTLAWDKRAIDLDDITGDDPSHIITGVRFRIVGTHLNLEARLSEFDYETGKLIEPHKNSFWKSNDNTDVSGVRRTQIHLKNPDIPSRSYVKSIPLSTHNQYIEFVNSDIDKDAAQSTVPFVDIQDVISVPAVPLSGVGIYYKGREQFGGFIAPKLITYDFSPHIRLPATNTDDEGVRTTLKK